MSLATIFEQPTNGIPTREEWLMEGSRVLKREFFGTRFIPQIACSCGWMKGAHKAIGQCFPPQHSATGVVNIFICPTQAEPVRVLDILLHELGHACLGTEAKHTAPFARLMREFGLKGKPTATFAEAGTECHDRLAKIAVNLGPYPHSAMEKVRKIGSKKVAWIKLVSPTDPDYKFSVPMNPSIEEHGFPLDPWGSEMEPE